jgi:DNA-binding MarR family transcriptional regulator
MITNRQQQALDWIKQQNPPPTMRELGKYLGVSRARASVIVHALSKGGHLSIKSYHPRGIKTE